MSVRIKNTETIDEESVLPPGQRDRSGFWYPAGYSDPKTLVRPRRRRRRRQPVDRDDAVAESSER